MHLIILTLHSLVRWAVLAGLGMGLFRAYRGWLGARPFTPFDDTVRHTAATVAHVQLVLGYALYFVSPLVASFHLRDAAHGPTTLFFGLQHVAAMTTAIVVLTAGSALAKRQTTDQAKFRTMALWFTAALLLILVAIPWPSRRGPAGLISVRNPPVRVMLKTSIGRLRLLGLLEGLSLLALLGIAVPLKHFYHDPSLVRALGPVHGLLFLLFVLNTLRVGVEYHWRFATTTWKVLLACIIPFGTFYVDRKILGPMQPGKA